MLAAGLLFAGHETAVAAIDRALVLLLTHLDTPTGGASPRPTASTSPAPPTRT